MRVEEHIVLTLRLDHQLYHTECCQGRSWVTFDDTHD